jgi:hypothetical protein
MLSLRAQSAKSDKAEEVKKVKETSRGSARAGHVGAAVPNFLVLGMV